MIRAACSACLREVYRDPDSGLWLHVGRPDLMNGLFCEPEEWEKDHGDRRYVTPLEGTSLVERLEQALQGRREGA